MSNKHGGTPANMPIWTDSSKLCLELITIQGGDRKQAGLTWQVTGWARHLHMAACPQTCQYLTWQLKFAEILSFSLGLSWNYHRSIKPLQYHSVSEYPVPDAESNAEWLPEKEELRLGERAKASCPGPMHVFTRRVHYISLGYGSEPWYPEGILE